MTRSNLKWISAWTLSVAGSVGVTAADDAPKKETLPLLRSVQGQGLTSPELPAVKLTFDKSFRYVGGHAFILYDVARAEQHFFADADDQGRIQRLYWVQFEGYLPSNDHTYRYRSTQTAKIGGLEFFADAIARNINANPGRPD